MIEMENDLNESCSSNLAFLREYHFQKEHIAILPQKLNFESLLAHLKINKYLVLISA